MVESAPTRESALEFLQSIVTDEEYRQSLLRRARAGTLSPEVEELVLHYALNPPAVPAEQPTTKLRLLKPLINDDRERHPD